MHARSLRAAFLLASTLALLLPGALARAEDAAPAEGEKPKPEGEKTKKPETDDTSIFKDWKLVKMRGVAHAKQRADFWTSKGTSGKDLFFLGLMWNRGEDYGKAAEALEKFLEYKPPADDQKAVDANLKNREFARKQLIDTYTRGKDYAKAVAAAEKFRDEFPQSPVAAETWDDQGRALRLSGDEAKAVECFGKAAEGKVVKGLMDLVDVHLANGDIDAAKAAFDKLPKEDAGFRDKFVAALKTFVDSVGTPGPSLDKVVSVGRGEAPALTGKTTLFYYWHLQLGLADRKMNSLESMRRGLSDKVNVVGIAKYNQYNPETEKIEKDMTPEQENDWYKKAIDKWGIGLPAIVAPNDVIDGLQIKFEGQFVITDAEGKLRYMRINQEQPYDRAAVEIALSKISERTAKPTTAPDAPK